MGDPKRAGSFRVPWPILNDLSFLHIPWAILNERTRLDCCWPMLSDLLYFKHCLGDPERAGSFRLLFGRSWDPERLVSFRHSLADPKRAGSFILTSIDFYSIDFY